MRERHVAGATGRLACSLLATSLAAAAAGPLAGAAWADPPAHPAASPWPGGAGLAPAPTPGASVGEGAPISRAEVLRRARSWVAQGVPYSQLAYWQDRAGSYRQDCSGFVSMAWGLPESVNYWTGNLGTVARPTPADALAPGDVLLSASHVVIFAGWANAEHTRFDLYEEAYPGSTARHVAGAALADYLARGFRPLRYARILDGPAAGPDAPAAAAGAGAPAAATPASWAAVGPDGARDVFAIRPDGRLWVSGQRSDLPAPAGPGAGAPSAPWRDLGDGGVRLVGSPVAVAAPDGALRVLALGVDGHAWSVARSTPGGSFGRWQDLGHGGTPLAGALTALTTANGAVELFALDREGRVVTASQTGPGDSAFGPYRSLGHGGAPLAGGLAALRTPQGSVAVVAADAAGRLWSATQAAGGATFGPWQGLGDPGAPIRLAPTLAMGHSGALELFAVDARGRLLAAARPSPDAPFDGWRDLGGPGAPFASGPAAARTATGHVQVFVRDATGRLASSWETPGSATGFGPWRVMGNNGIDSRAGVFAGTPTATLAPTGGVAVYVSDRAGQLWSSAQAGPWQPFTPWQDLRGN